MATTGKWVFERAIYLMDEAGDINGLADIAETRDYKARSIHILNVLIPELFPISDTWPGKSSPGKRPLAGLIVNLDDDIPLDDGLARGVLPYGLAGSLLIEESPASAAYFMNRFIDLSEKFRKNLPAPFISIEDVYGGI